MKRHLAEFVSPGHPDRLADAVVESCVELAVSRDPDALVGVECAVHDDAVFLDGRIAAGRDGAPAVSRDELSALVRAAYRAAGYGGRWTPAPDALRVFVEVCLEPLRDDERAIRGLSDDQNAVLGYACNRPETGFLPPAHFVANAIGRRVAAWRAGASDRFGPDFKVLVSLREEGGRFAWERLTLSIQHAPDVDARARHDALAPVVADALAALERGGLRGVAALDPERFVLNGAGDFVQGGPEGDNGLSGKKLAVDFYGPGVPLGGGAICGKDPHKVDVCGAFRARQFAVRLVRERGCAEALVRLGWTPGDAAPAHREALLVDAFGLARPLPERDLPPADWFSIGATVRDLGLVSLPRRRLALDGYFASWNAANRPTMGKSASAGHRGG